MTDYNKLVEALRSASTVSTAWEKLMHDAAAAIEALQAQLPKQGEWEVKGANRMDCSVCGHSVCFAFGLSEGSFDLYKYCPECGAKMNGEQNVE